MAESLWRRVLHPGRPHPVAAPQPPVPRVLALTVAAEDHDFYRALRDRREWDIVLVQTLAEALSLLASRDFPVVLCDRDLPGRDWRDALTRMVACSPDSCFLLTSRVSDEFLWREVVTLGGYDVVTRPLAEPALSRTLQRALYYRKTGPPPGGAAKTE